jgi:hypothetical protein
MAAEVISRALGATTAFTGAPDRIAAEGISTADDDDTGWLGLGVEDIGELDFLFASSAVMPPLRWRSTDRRELAALFAGWVATETPWREAADRPRVLVAGEAEVDGELTATDELESGEDEPEVVVPSSAAAMAGVAPNATPTPAVTAPIWSHRSTGNVAESRFERRIPLWLGMIELLGKDVG